MAHVSPFVTDRRFGGVKISVGPHTGTVGIDDPTKLDTLTEAERNAATAWVWEMLNFYGHVHASATPLTVRDMLFGRLA